MISKVILYWLTQFSHTKVSLLDQISSHHDQVRLVSIDLLNYRKVGHFCTSHIVYG